MSPRPDLTTTIAANSKTALGIAEAPNSGCLVVNADDWGCDRLTTQSILDCIECQTVSSVSAMVFMADSERAAEIAREHRIDAGLHLNLTTPFSGPVPSTRLADCQRRIAKFLQSHRLAVAVFHPGLVNCFEYLVAAQRQEFARLYGREPLRIDGHHHMHLCANVVLRGLLPAGTIVRRNFSFRPGEKSWCNRSYRRVFDRILARDHSLTDFFFSLTPLNPPGRLQKIFLLARQSTVEMETHPANPVEYRYLTEGGFLASVRDVPIVRGFAVHLLRLGAGAI